jgi:hypothetical protein
MKDLPLSVGYQLDLTRMDMNFFACSGLGNIRTKIVGFK